MKRLRVYLSSTYEDLKAYREAVFAALEKGGLDVARMEAYTAADERPLEKCLRDVAQSDIYVGVYAWRYGYEPPAEHGNPDGKSITELEYRKAESANLRKLLFFAHPDTLTGWPDRFKDATTGAGEQGKKLDRFRKELGTEKTASFYRTPDELATLVLAAIMRSGMSGRVYNVPPLPSGFVPRPNLADAIVKALIGDSDKTQGHSTLVQGAGGFGKTTLAIDACHHAEVVNAFPDGMLWTSLGENPDLGRILSDLHVLATGNPPAVAGLEQIGQAIAKALEARRCLVVVDDAWRAEDLAPFLQLNGPTLLVTTRIRTLMEEAGQDGWPEVSVEEMKADEAAAILGRGLALEGPTQDAVHRLADRLGCWPLLLELANARLREEQKSGRGSVGKCIDFVATLFEKRGVLGFDRRDSKARNAAVSRSVEVGLELADEMFHGLAQRTAELSVFPENVAVPTPVLSDLWRMDEFDVEEEVLRPLGNLSLLRWDREAKEIRLHMMIDRALKERLKRAEGGLAAVNRKLIDAWGDPCRLPHDYAWRWFGWHCVQADDLPRLRSLLLDFNWLRAKLNATDINALLGEFDNVNGDQQVEQINDALRLSAHVLAKDKALLAGQLLARIPEQQSGLRGRILEGARAIREPWLRPLWASLTSPGGPLLRTLEGHSASVATVAHTPDGKRAVSGSWDRTLKLWEHGEVLRTLEGHSSGVAAVALTPDGKRAVSGSADRTLKLWDLERGEVLRTLEGHSAFVAAVALTPDGKRAVSGSWDRTLKLWDLERGEVLRTLEGHSASVAAVVVTPDGKRAVSGSADRTLKLWDLERGEVLRTLEGHTSRVAAVVLTPDGKRAVSGSWDRTLKLWDLECGEVLRTLEGHSFSVAAVALTPDGKRAVSGSSDRTLKLWDLERGEMLRTLEGHSGHVNTVALTPDGKRAVSGGADGTLKIWDLERTEVLRTLERHSAFVAAVVLTPDGKRAVSGSWDRTLKLWDLERGEVLRTLEGHTSRVAAVVVTLDGKRAVSGSKDGTLKIWDLERGEVLRTLEGHSFRVNTVALTPDGKRAVSGSSDGTLRLWDLERGEMLRTLEGHPARVNTVALTPDGKRAVSGGLDGALKIWDLERGEMLRTLEGHSASVTTVVLTPDGKRAVSGSWDRTLKIWDLERGEVLRSLEGHWIVDAVALTPDGKRAVSGSKDGTLKIWDLETGEFVATFGAESAVHIAAVATDGRKIVAGDAEGRVHLLWLENADAIATESHHSFLPSVRPQSTASSKSLE